MKKLTAYFFDGFNFSIQTLRFKQLLYVFLITKISYWLYYYDLYFGNNAIAYTKPQSLGKIKDLAFLLYHHTAPAFGYFFIFGSLLFLVLSYLVKKIPFLFEFLLWFAIINIHNKIYPTLTGGDLLLNQFLFFNCFLAKKYDTTEDQNNSLLKCLHNFGVLAIIIQIQIVYLVAGLAKINNNAWLQGLAINDLGYVKHFNLYSGPVVKSAFINYCLDYSVMFYQLLFPILIWIPKIKKPLIILGICMHLYISFITGLVGFGLIMMIGYIFFWPIKKQIA